VPRHMVVMGHMGIACGHPIIHPPADTPFTASRFTVLGVGGFHGVEAVPEPSVAGEDSVVGGGNASKKRTQGRGPSYHSSALG